MFCRRRGMAPPKPRSPAICSLPEPSRATIDSTYAAYVLRRSWTGGVFRTDEHWPLKKHNGRAEAALIAYYEGIIRYEKEQT